MMTQGKRMVVGAGCLMTVLGIMIVGVATNGQDTNPAKAKPGGDQRPGEDGRGSKFVLKGANDIEIVDAGIGWVPLPGGNRLPIYKDAKIPNKFYYPPLFLFDDSTAGGAVEIEKNRLMINFVGSSQGIEETIGKWLAEQFKNTDAVPAKTPRIISPIPLAFYSMSFQNLFAVSDPLPYRWPAGRNAADVTEVPARFKASWVFADEKAATEAMRQVKLGQASVSVNYAFFGAHVRGVRVSVKTSDIIKEDWKNHVRPQGDLMNDKQYFTLEQIGVILRNTASRVDFEVLKDGVNYSLNPLLYKMLLDFTKTAMDQEVIDIADKANAGRSDIYVGKDVFKPSEIYKWYHERHTRFELHLKSFLESVTNETNEKQYESLYQECNKQLLHEIQEMKVGGSGSVDIFDVLGASASGDVNNRSDSLNESSKYLKDYKKEAWRKKYESQFRHNISRSITQITNLIDAGEGRMILPPRKFSIYRINKTAWDNNREFFYRETEIVQGSRLVNLQRSIENATGVTARSAFDFQNQLSAMSAQIDGLSARLKAVMNDQARASQLARIPMALEGGRFGGEFATGYDVRAATFELLNNPRQLPATMTRDIGIGLDNNSLGRFVNLTDKQGLAGYPIPDRLQGKSIRIRAGLHIDKGAVRMGIFDGANVIVIEPADNPKVAIAQQNQIGSHNLVEFDRILPCPKANPFTLWGTIVLDPNTTVRLAYLYMEDAKAEADRKAFNEFLEQSQRLTKMLEDKLKDVDHRSREDHILIREMKQVFDFEKSIGTALDKKAQFKLRDGTYAVLDETGFHFFTADGKQGTGNILKVPPKK